MSHVKTLTRFCLRASGFSARQTFKSIAKPYICSSRDLQLEDTLQQLDNAFCYEPHHIHKFQKYIKSGDSFSLTDDFEDTHCIRITSNGETTFRSAFGLIGRDDDDPHLFEREDFCIIRLIRVALLEPERGIALVTLQGGDAKRALKLMLELLRDDDYWTKKVPDIPFSDRDILLPPLFLQLGRRVPKLPSTLLRPAESLTAQRAPFAYGSSAYVYKGQLDNIPVALKHPRYDTSMTEGIQDVQKEYTRRECLMWSPLCHPNIVRLQGINDNLFNGAPCMISPLLDELLKIIKASRRKGEYPETAQLNNWILDISAGLAYLHSRRIIHGDLRADNVLVDKNDVALVADLGLAFFADPNSWLPNFEAVDGQPSPWHAPELKDSLDRSRPLERTFATDVFAFGCVCLEIYTSNPPFENRKSDRTADLRPTTPLGQIMDERLWEIIGSCLSDSPADRPTMVEVSKTISLLSSEWS